MKLAAVASAVLAAALSLSACDLAATFMQTGASPPAAPQPSCHQQYEAWKHGVVGGKFAVFRSAYRAVARAAHQDATKLATALKHAGTAANWLSATPPPRCADPKGYYGQMLATATAAADSAKAATRLSADAALGALEARLRAGMPTSATSADVESAPA